MTDVYLNSKFVGTVEDGRVFAQQLIIERRSNNISANINVIYKEDSDEVFIEGDKGRIKRPLIIVKEGKPLLTEKHLDQLQKGELVFSDLVKQGVIEFIDAAEEENAYVSFNEEDLTPEHTHLEIAPTAILGLAASLAPYCDYSPGARVNVGTKNQKHSIGFYASNFPIRMDMDVNILYTPQKPIVSTIMENISEQKDHPAGQNIIVAVMSYEGYNMEDAVILNRGSIQRGFGRSSYFRPAIAEELRYAGGLTDEVSIPDKEVKGYRSEDDYKLLEEDGIVYPEAKVTEGDVVIGKTSPPRFLSSLDEYSLTGNIRRESSVSMKHGEEGVVDFVLISESEEGNKLVQVRIRDERIPEIGDKFTSRSGQKGIVGMVVNQSDMPFSASGITPDLIFSPHSIPSRMTIHYLLELIGGKVGSLAGRSIDGTTFSGEPEKELRKNLLNLGFKENGTETLYNPLTGEQYQAKIFIGDMYYLRLKHLVANRIHSRARGPIQLLTRQPTEGRAKEGGLRLGEMEKDTFIAHGASLLLKERFDSDKTIIPICENCGIVAVYNEYKDKAYCPICGDNVEINNIEMSYAFKLILDEFKSLGIYPKLVLENKY